MQLGKVMGNGASHSAGYGVKWGVGSQGGLFWAPQLQLCPLNPFGTPQGSWEEPGLDNQEEIACGWGKAIANLLPWLAWSAQGVIGVQASGPTLSPLHWLLNTVGLASWD